MRKILIGLVFLYANLMSINAQEKTFSEKALQDKLVNLKGGEDTFEDVLEAFKGKVVLIDIWASWCKDCVVGMPTVKKLKNDFKEVSFLYISLDRTKESWKKGIKKLGIEDGTHYWASKGWKSDLFTAIDLDWIPRYMVIDKDGTIKLYKAIKAGDKEIIKQLTK